MHPDDPDFDLVPAAVEGDLDAFEALVRRYQSRMVSFARTLTRRPEDAEDLAQEVFVRVFKALGKFRGQRFLIGVGTGLTAARWLGPGTSRRC